MGLRKGKCTDELPIEEFVRKPWQSFSTMKRFISEAPRLENASWRLWFMQNRREMMECKAAKNMLVGTSALQKEEETVNIPQICIYCNLAVANLSCTGCCHDPYCVSCFKLIHMRGHLASHTASKIHYATNSNIDMTSNIQQYALTQNEPIYTNGKITRPSVGTNDDTQAKKASNWKNTVQTKQQPGMERIQPPLTKVKSWEQQMDMLFQRLMVTSIPQEGDISVHNIDNSSVGFENTSPLHSNSGQKSISCKNCLGPHMTIACPKLEQPTLPSIIEHNATGTDSLPNTPVHSSFNYVTQTNNNSIATCATNSTTTTSNNAEGMANTISNTTEDAVNLAQSSSKRKKTCGNCRGAHMTINCPLLETSFTQPSINAINAAEYVSSPVGSGGNAGVEAMLRRCFTTLHNDNTSNSTHAYLGDEISVHGGGEFGTEFGNTGKASGKGYPLQFEATIVEEEISIDNNSQESVFPALLVVLNSTTKSTLPGGVKRKPHMWITSALEAELPEELLPNLSETRFLCSENCMQNYEYKGWVYLRRKKQTKWRHRFVVIYRNYISEYLSESIHERAIGFTCLSEGSLRIKTPSNLDDDTNDDNDSFELTVEFTTTAIREDGKTSCEFHFESNEDMQQWILYFKQAMSISVDDLFEDGTGDNVSILNSNNELGHGRFSVVRKAKRKFCSKFSQNERMKTNDCALKIIDKNAFWTLVDNGTERGDTLFREVLTQGLLTLKCNFAPCPIVQLLSLFETHDYLVMELELMKGGDLFDIMDSRNGLPEYQAAYLIRNLIKSIQYCLENNVAHRDIKLSNLAMDIKPIIDGDLMQAQRSISQCTLKLADFGMAAFVQSDGMLRGRCGTPGYVAPEILMAGIHEAYPAHVDMFSVGVVLYILLCGYEPFYGRNDKELIAMNKSAIYEFHEEEWGNISNDAKDLVYFIYSIYI